MVTSNFCLFFSSLFLNFVLLGFVEGTSFVPSIGNQWPWYKWTTTANPNEQFTTPSPAQEENWTSGPPPQVTFLPPPEHKSRDKFLILFDPEDYRTFIIRKDIFWESLLRETKKDRLNPRKPVQCDIFTSNCWTPSTHPFNPEESQTIDWYSGIRDRVYNPEREDSRPYFPVKNFRKRGSGVGGMK